MAKIQKKTSIADPSKPKASALACFGFSKKVIRSPEKETKYIGRSDEHKIKRQWFCAYGFGLKKSATQTVPIDLSSTASEKRGPSNKIDKSSKVNNCLESKSKPGSNLVSGPATDREIEVVPPPPQQKPQPQMSNVINLENRRHLDSSKEDTCQKRVSFCSKIDSMRTGVVGGGGSGCSEPGSPAANSTRRAAVMTQSASFPTPKSERRFVQSKWGNMNERKKLEPVIGMSIIVVTLIIMIVWGRLCAILCTSAWFYFVPRLITTTASTTPTTTQHHQISSNSNSRNQLDFNSDHYKKKVVLQGFLERNHRN